MPGKENQPISPQYTLIFDGNCNVCRRTVDLLRGWDPDGILEIVPSQSPSVRERFPWIPAENYDVSMQVIAADGRAFQGARALEELLEALPRGRLFSWVFRIPLVRPLAERLYRWFARHRLKLGCGDHCSLR